MVTQILLVKDLVHVWVLVINDNACGLTLLFECIKESWFSSQDEIGSVMDLVDRMFENPNQA
jgi:hypothetical protein